MIATSRKMLLDQVISFGFVDYEIVLICSVLWNGLWREEWNEQCIIFI